MQSLMTILHVLIAFAIIGLVLLQHGKGADMGASFGGGAANTMFGSMGPASFLLKLTMGLGLSFFATSLILGVMSSHQTSHALDFLNTPAPTSINLAPSMPELPSIPASPASPVSSESPVIPSASGA
jgi:preprotein translocase subunit SecG